MTDDSNVTDKPPPSCLGSQQIVCSKVFGMAFPILYSPILPYTSKNPIQQ